MNVRKFSLPEIFFGRGSLEYAGGCARILGAEKVFSDYNGFGGRW
ncbi:Uncharacterized protein dnm_090760 [Desulfonema magnum]|uniref:Uncharacterized protein n=2 Tax=Desulfonema magnum TaxID=45655 RepID=A0A975GUA4_9BACT|nr:Uncharacterized protein dnm_090760 [Desulfonema magnum]